MFVLYLDELGHDGVWDPDDPKHAHHPLFGLAGVVVPGDRCRDLDRGFLRLKKSFYAFEVASAAARGIRPERFEHKELRNRRDVRFTVATFDLVRRLGGTAFVYAVEKEKRVDKGDLLYGRVAQGTIHAFEKFLRKKAGTRLGVGVMVMDRRSELRDVALLSWMQSYLFSDAIQRGFNRIVETPLLVRSDWYHGVQVADTVARAAGHVFRYAVTGEQKYRKSADALRDGLHELEARDGRWSTIYMKPLYAVERWDFSVSEMPPEAVEAQGVKSEP